MGHKFFRLDLAKSATENRQQEQGLQTGWQFHLGSTGCQSASVMRSPKHACAYPNKPRFTLTYQHETNLVLDLAPLLSDILNKPELAENSCMSDPHTLICKALLPKIGINGPSQLWHWQS